MYAAIHFIIHPDILYVMQKPQPLLPGDTIAFIAPASGLAAVVTHRLEQAKKFWEGHGYKVKMYPTATKNSGLSSDTPQARAKDIMDAFLDDKVKAIIATIGGNSTHQTLQYLDFALLAKHPKIFCGYSDVTSLQLALYSQSNMVSFYGPAAITQWGDFPTAEQYTFDHFIKAVSATIGVVSPSPTWTDDKSQDWFKKDDLKGPRPRFDNPGYTWLHEGKVSAPILGGCLPVILHLRGTKYWPDFSGKVLLLETPEGEDHTKGSPLSYVDSAMADLALSDVFKQVAGVVFGRGFGYDEKERQQLQSLVKEYTAGYNYPVVYGVDIGHSDPMITVPLGVQVSLDSDKNLFSIDETGVNL